VGHGAGTVVSGEAASTLCPDVVNLRTELWRPASSASLLARVCRATGLSTVVLKPFSLAAVAALSRMSIRRRAPASSFGIPSSRAPARCLGRARR
jgi:hypothetical protein